MGYNYIIKMEPVFPNLYGIYCYAQKSKFFSGEVVYDKIIKSRYTSDVSEINQIKREMIDEQSSIIKGFEDKMNAEELKTLVSQKGFFAWLKLFKLMVLT